MSVKITDEEYKYFAEFKQYILEKHKEKLFDSKLKGAAVQNLKDDFFLSEFAKAADKIFSGKFNVTPYKFTSNKRTTKRVINLYLSDLHFHSLLSADELPLTYGPQEEARRLAHVIQETIEYKTQYRNETELYLHIAGDVIQGKLHDVETAAPLAAQMCAAIHLLSQAITLLSSAFPRVKVFTTPGNHGRNKSRHDKRATSEKWDAHETVIYYAIKKSVANLKNVEVFLTKKPYYTFKPFNEQGFSTHGDTIIKPGNPGKSINISSVSNQINKINADHKDKFSLFIVGHVHTGVTVRLPGNIVFMTNGCLIPPDGFAVSEGYFDGTCGQQLWETVDGYMVGDQRFLVVDKDTDKNPAFDKLILPFSAFK